MGRDTDLVQMREDVFGDAVVENALPVDDFVLLLVECRCIVLEELNQRAGLGTLIEDLCLALVNAAARWFSLLLASRRESADAVDRSLKRSLNGKPSFSQCADDPFLPKRRAIRDSPLIAEVCIALCTPF
jgi:hypothetical protein